LSREIGDEGWEECDGGEQGQGGGKRGRNGWHGARLLLLSLARQQPLEVAGGLGKEEEKRERRIGGRRRRRRWRGGRTNGTSHSRCDEVEAKP
jgi:hypothetical protein